MPALEHPAPEEPSDGAHSRVSRRALLVRAGRGAFGVATLPLAGWIAACGQALTASPPPATPAQTPRPTATPTPTPDTRPVSVAITGDIMLGRSVNTEILATNDRYPFNGTADYLHGFDVTAGNLECVVSTLGQPVNKQYTFRGDPKGFGRLTAAGFDVVSVANNHSGDYGTAAYVDMLAQLPANGIAPLGGGATLRAAHQPVIKTIRSTRVGFLAYCEVEPMSFAATRTTPGHAWLDPALMQTDITAPRAQADFVIVFMHWGLEYQSAQTGHQRAMARLAIDSGADFVVGAHPHVIQPFEVYNGKPIVYSLGNFVFDEMTEESVRRGDVLTLLLQGPQLLAWKLRGSHITGNLGQPQWAS
jgi:poly-gamma-glutamate capsule biosynthesis protein CapA/YwtB (metallophosphatase superfamily)